VSWSTKELEGLLYWWRDPRQARRAVKIAPGREAKDWNDCRVNNYICAGWDEIGDLTQFESKDVFKERFEEVFPYNGNRAQSSRKANEVWTLRELEPGDLVIANRGKSHILAVGEVRARACGSTSERTELR